MNILLRIKACGLGEKLKELIECLHTILPIGRSAEIRGDIGNGAQTIALSISILQVRQHELVERLLQFLMLIGIRGTDRQRRVSLEHFIGELQAAICFGCRAKRQVFGEPCI